MSGFVGLFFFLNGIFWYSVSFLRYGWTSERVLAVASHLKMI